MPSPSAHLPLDLRAAAVDRPSSVDDARALRCTAGVAAGDPEALADLYAWWKPIMLAWARNATHRDDATAHDVVHDAFLKVITRAEPIASASTLGAWLRAVTLRTAYDTLRAESRRARRERTPRAASPNAPASAPPASARTERAELLAAIESELAALSRDHRELLDARFRFGWTLAHTGRVLGLSPSLIDSRVRRTVASLRTNLESSSTTPGGDT